MHEAISIEKYLKLLDRYSEYNNCYFRGQLEKYKTTPPSISRQSSYLNNEHHIYNEAIAIAKKEFDGLFYPVEKLSKMQHYGIPTRLVDITIDPLIALYFAVENTQDPSHANVYVYIQDDFDINDNEVKAVSLLATTKYSTINELCEDFNSKYCEKITDTEIKKLIEKPVFLKHLPELQKSNPRLFNQKGSFAICTNVVNEDNIISELKSIDSIPSIMTIRIPYEHKTKIKNALDKEHNINETIIYPELTSVASYLRNKYTYITKSYDGSFEIMESSPVNTVFANRLSIKAILTSQFPIEDIENIAIKIIDENISNNDVVWLFIYKTKEDYIVNNYIIRTQWISPNLQEKYIPSLLKHKIKDNYYYQYGTGYSTLADYYEEHVFIDDKSLFIDYKLNFENAANIFNEILIKYKSLGIESIIPVILKEKAKIRKYYMNNGEFGRSKTIKLEDLFKEYDVFFAKFDNLHVWCENKKSNQASINYQLQRMIDDLPKMIGGIRENNSFWESELNICKDDYIRHVPSSSKRKPFSYTQTIPVKKDAVNVFIEEKAHINTDKTFYIYGTTNLFDNASIMLYIRDTKGKILAQNKTTIAGGRFSFSTMSQKGKGFEDGEYYGCISLSIPSTQPKEFIKQSGIEYECLTGDLINRTGHGPSLSYEFVIEI